MASFVKEPVPSLDPKTEERTGLRRREPAGNPSELSQPSFCLCSRLSLHGQPRRMSYEPPAGLLHLRAAGIWGLRTFCSEGFPVRFGMFSSIPGLDAH